MKALMKLSLALVVLAAAMWRSEGSCGIAVYWGQNTNEGSLKDACSRANPLYKYVIIGHVTTFGGGNTLVLNLAGHCNAASGSCKKLASEIQFCQSKGVKVLISLGGPKGTYTLDSPQDASDVADNILFSYLLSGGVFGDVVLDGVDLDIQVPGSPDNWDELAKALSKLYKPDGDKFVLSASPGCSYPDPNLDAAINTGLFDHVWVRFYDNGDCDYTGGLDAVVAAWSQWSSGVPVKTDLSLGLPAASDAAGSGYIEASNLKGKVLGVVKSKAPKNYGGIMLWNRMYDIKGNYSSTVFNDVCRGRPFTHFISQVI